MTHPIEASRNPAVRVVMTVRDHAPLVEEAIDSGRCQPPRDRELIVIDDGSVDATPAIPDRHATEDARLRSVHRYSAVEEREATCR